MDWSGTTALVTGAGGFIGGHLCEALARRGACVRAFVHYNSRGDWGSIERLGAEARSRIEVVPGDVRDPFAVRRAVADAGVVFHLAALIGIPYSYAAPEADVSVNVQGALNMLQACRDEGVRRLVHVSTSETYGTARYAPIDEEHPLRAQSPYAATKIAADKLAESFHLSFGLPVAIARPFNAYGPGQSARAVVPAIVCQALKAADGKDKRIRLGSLEPVRDMTYVEDTVRGLIAAAEADGAVGETINLGTGRGVSIGELARMILDRIDPAIAIERDERRARPESSEVMRLICDNAKARRLLGWSPEVSLEEGLERAIAFVRLRPELYKPGRYAL